MSTRINTITSITSLDVSFNPVQIAKRVDICSPAHPVLSTFAKERHLIRSATVTSAILLGRRNIS